MLLNKLCFTYPNPSQHQQTHHPLIILLLIAPVVLGCGTSTDTANKRAKHFVPQYPTAHIIQLAKHLKRGMSKTEVKKIIGQPYYSPLNGLYYYSWKNSKSLVLDYRNQQDDITPRLQSFWIAQIGEQDTIKPSSYHMLPAPH
jgi:hypothetical protein